MGVGDAKQDSKALEAATEQLATIAGQRPNVRRARKSIAAFKLREGMPVGVSVTLRGERSYEFLDRLMSVAIPRIRDFRGMNPRSFDGRGNYSLGVREQIIFPEIDYDAIDQTRGLDITITTSAKTDLEAFALLERSGSRSRDRRAGPRRGARRRAAAARPRSPRPPRSPAAAAARTPRGRGGCRARGRGGGGRRSSPSTEAAEELVEELVAAELVEERGRGARRAELAAEAELGPRRSATELVEEPARRARGARAEEPVGSPRQPAVEEARASRCRGRQRAGRGACGRGEPAAAEAAAAEEPAAEASVESVTEPAADADAPAAVRRRAETAAEAARRGAGSRRVERRSRPRRGRPEADEE